MTPRIYTDTSVIGGCLDEEFKEASLQLINMFNLGTAVLVVSDLTLLELEAAPAGVRAVLEDIPEKHKEYIELTAGAVGLAQHYIDAGVIGATKRVDAQHNRACRYPPR